MGRSLFLLAVVVFVSLFIWLSRTRTVAHADESWNAHYLRIEQKTKNAETDDPTALRALADEVFDQAHVFGTQPDLVKAPLKDRVVRAELAYRQGQGKPVMHSDIGCNHEYKGQHEDGTPLQPGEKVNAMSPSQASYLIMSAVDQKLINTEYHVDPDEWEAPHQKKQQKAAAESSSSQPGRRLYAISGPGQMELMRGAQSRLLKLTPDESTTFAHRVLDNMGISR